MGIVVRQSLKGTFVNYVGVVFGAVLKLYCGTKWLGESMLGLSNVIYEAAVLFSVLALMGSANGGMRFFPYFKDKETGNHGFFYYYLLFPLVGIPALSLIYLALREPITEFFAEKSAQFNEFYYYVLPLMAVLALWQWWEGYANIHMRIAVPKAIREIVMRIFIFVIYYAYYVQWIDVKGFFIVFIIAYGLAMLMTGIYTSHISCTVVKHDWSYVTPQLKSKVLRYSGFMMFATLSGNIMAQLDLWMLTGLKGLYDAGIYSIVLYMVEVTNMPSRNITPIATPLAADAMKQGDLAEARTLYSRVSIHQTLAASILLLLIWINIDNIFAIMPRGESFSAGKWALLFLGLSKVIYGMLNFGNTLISFSKYYYWTLAVTVLLTLLTIGTNLMFIKGIEQDLYFFTLRIPAMGVTGAAMATLLTTCLSYCYQQYIVQVKVKVNPFTWAHLRIGILIAVLYGINCLVPSLSGISPWLDIVARSLVFVVAGIALAYHLRISPQIESYIRQYVLRK